MNTLIVKTPAIFFPPAALCFVVNVNRRTLSASSTTAAAAAKLKAPGEIILFCLDKALVCIPDYWTEVVP